MANLAKELNIENPAAITRAFGVFLAFSTPSEALKVISTDYCVCGECKPWQPNEVAFIAFNLGAIDYAEFTVRKLSGSKGAADMDFIRKAWASLVASFSQA